MLDDHNQMLIGYEKESTSHIIDNFLSSCVWCECRRKDHPFYIDKGIINLRNWDFRHDGVLNLDGEWAFYAKKFLVSDGLLDELENPVEFLKVPGYFNQYIPPSGERLSGRSYVTYKLRVLLPDKPTQLAIHLGSANTAHHLYLVNSSREIIDLEGRGIPGKSEKKSSPSFLPFYTGFVASGNVDLVWEVSNYHDYLGGIKFPPTIGTPRGIAFSKRHLAIYATFGAVFIISLYNFIIFGFHRKETVSLWLGITGMLVCTLMTIQSGLFLTGLDLPDGNFLLFSIGAKIMLLSIGLLPIVFIKFLTHLLLKEKSDLLGFRSFRGVCFIVYLTSGIFLFLVAILSTYRATQLMVYFFPTLAITMIWGLITLYWQWIRYKDRAILLSMTGFLIIVAASVNDILFTFQLVRTGLYYQFGFVLFIITQGFVLARLSAISRSKNEIYRLTIERQSKDLKQLNLILQKKAEAMKSSLLEQSPDKIIAVDDKLIVFYCNRSEQEKENPFGKPVAEIVEPAALILVQKALKKVFANGESEMIEIHTDRAVPKQWYEYRFAGIKEESGAVIEAMIIITNITKRKQAEQELKILQKELIEKAHKAGRGGHRCRYFA